MIHLPFSTNTNLQNLPLKKKDKPKYFGEQKKKSSPFVTPLGLTIRKSTVLELNMSIGADY